jgi:hypothetical protein
VSPDEVVQFLEAVSRCAVHRHAKRRHLPARRKTIPMIPPRKSRRAFIQSGFGFNEVPDSGNKPIARRGDLTEASRFPKPLRSDSRWQTWSFAMTAAILLPDHVDGSAPPLLAMPEAEVVYASIFCAILTN